MTTYSRSGKELQGISINGEIDTNVHRISLGRKLTTKDLQEDTTKHTEGK